MALVVIVFCIMFPRTREMKLERLKFVQLLVDQSLNDFREKLGQICSERVGKKLNGKSFHIHAGTYNNCIVCEGFIRYL